MAVQGTVGTRHVPTTAWVLAGFAVASIWAGVLIASSYAPDFVSGSQHEHLKLVAGLDWIWGLVATSFVVLAALHGIRARVVDLVPWRALAAGVAVVWLLVALISIRAPVFVTGTDPTIIPFGALGIPIVGVFLTWFVCTLVRALFEEYAS
jgi:hypothetical protein